MTKALFMMKSTSGQKEPTVVCFRVCMIQIPVSREEINNNMMPTF